MDSSSHQPWKPEEVLAHCSHQAKRIKKLTRSANALAKHTKTQGEKVKAIANDAAQAISFDFSSCQIENDAESTANIQSRLEELLSKARNDVKHNTSLPMDSGCSSSGLRKESPPGSTKDDSRLPTLPCSVPTFVIDDVSTDDVSESGSDFFPDWSSVDSCSSSIYSISGRAPCKYDVMAEDAIYLNDEDFLKLPDNDIEIMTDDELQFCSTNSQENYSFRDFFNKGECTMMVELLQPAPAAGNDDPRSINPQSAVERVTSTLPSASPMKLSALRRVKSMVMENDLQDSVEVGKRMLKVRQKQIQASMTAQPSPLLTTDDIAHVKKSTSQTSTKYSLKRSRSNISAELSSAKRNNATWYTEKEPGIFEVQEDVCMEDAFLPS